MAAGNDECVICNAPYHTGYDRKTRRTEKLTRAKHLAHVRKRVDSAIKAKKRSAVLEQHEARLAFDEPAGAVKYKGPIF
jgi:hypothetical protein